MPLKITHRKEEDVPTATKSGQVNEDLMAVKDAMQKLATDMVLEIEAESEKAVRGTKMLITKAANQLGREWQYWSLGSKVFARPKEKTSRRGRRKKT